MHLPVPSTARTLWLRFRLNEVGPLLSLLALAVCAWVFIELADYVTEGQTHEWDQAIMLALRNPQNPADPLGPGWLEEAARDITALGGTTILLLVTFAAIVYLLMAGKKAAAVLVFVTVDGGLLLSNGLKMLFDRPRPDLVAHAVRVYTASFPSGHAMLSAVVYLTLGALLTRIVKRRRIKVFFMGLAIFLTLMVGSSRVYLGVHWPSDVLAGWCVGAAWASLCWFIALQLQRGGQVERPGEHS
ncbi:phosphatase PAP2 family protein [Microvirga pudoricolor]|uniref:phosphatase PAP2 family protein n=1 Tax=Microvirga pudoricolor TaxID=2778729 RepID=UPI001950F108|nr:phosphatase PAP2 family protein [Microvirga pudoricolor]MBM6593805.1 phosphatase PAP2 family protein [Microvirga pudoricolor]